MTEFYVSSSGPDRVRVAWADQEADYYFLAKVAGDEITEITTGYRKFPTIFRLAKLGRERHRGTQALSANEPAYVPIVDEARIAIRAERLATRAMEVRAAERAEVAAKIVAEKAAKLRTIMGEHRLPTLPEVADAVLAEVYDAIQNSAL
jgi:hypothetical protein